MSAISNPSNIKPNNVFDIITGYLEPSSDSSIQELFFTKKVREFAEELIHSHPLFDEYNRTNKAKIISLTEKLFKILSDDGYPLHTILKMNNDYKTNPKNTNENIAYYSSLNSGMLNFLVSLNPNSANQFDENTSNWRALTTALENEDVDALKSMLNALPKELRETSLNYLFEFSKKYIYDFLRRKSNFNPIIFLLSQGAKFDLGLGEVINLIDRGVNLFSLYSTAWEFSSTDKFAICCNFARYLYTLERVTPQQQDFLIKMVEDLKITEDIPLSDFESSLKGIRSSQIYRFRYSNCSLATCICVQYNDYADENFTKRMKAVFIKNKKIISQEKWKAIFQNHLANQQQSASTNNQQKASTINQQ